ncbi:MAG: FtsW/RodA/SpoVE family cell cycle protein, partial [Wujia sp.]
IAIILSAYVLVKGISSHGASRWISIGGQQFQPSEICKPILILYMAHICVAESDKLSDLKGIFKVVFWPMVCILLIGKENLSTAIVCFAIVVVILFVASPKFLHLLLLGMAGVAIAVIGVFAAGYRGDRFEAWLNPETSENGFQTMQSLYAIGSGGLFGRGLGQSIQKQGFLPESHNDMIFSVICEELGLFGAIAVIILFIMLLISFKNIANNSPDSYGGFIITGIMTHIAVQTLVNIGVVTNTIPNTGVTLPFISYGGTSLLFLMVEMGIVLGISRQANPIK